MKGAHSLVIINGKNTPNSKIKEESMSPNSNKLIFKNLEYSDQIELLSFYKDLQESKIKVEGHPNKKTDRENLKTVLKDLKQANSVSLDYMLKNIIIEKEKSVFKKTKKNKKESFVLKYECTTEQESEEIEKVKEKTILSTKKYEDFTKIGDINIKNEDIINLIEQTNKKNVAFKKDSTIQLIKSENTNTFKSPEIKKFKSECIKIESTPTFKSKTPHQVGEQKSNNCFSKLKLKNSQMKSVKICKIKKNLLNKNDEISKKKNIVVKKEEFIKKSIEKEYMEKSKKISSKKKPKKIILYSYLDWELINFQVIINLKMIREEKRKKIEISSPKSLKLSNKKEIILKIPKNSFTKEFYLNKIIIPLSEFSINVSDLSTDEIIILDIIKEYNKLINEHLNEKIMNSKVHFFTIKYHQANLLRQIYLKKRRIIKRNFGFTLYQIYLFLRCQKQIENNEFNFINSLLKSYFCIKLKQFEKLKKLIISNKTLVDSAVYFFEFVQKKILGFSEDFFFNFKTLKIRKKNSIGRKCIRFCFTVDVFLFNLYKNLNIKEFFDNPRVVIEIFEYLKTNKTVNSKVISSINEKYKQHSVIKSITSSNYTNKIKLFEQYIENNWKINEMFENKKWIDLFSEKIKEKELESLSKKKVLRGQSEYKIKRKNNNSKVSFFKLIETKSTSSNQNDKSKEEEKSDLTFPIPKKQEDVKSLSVSFHLPKSLIKTSKSKFIQKLFEFCTGSIETLSREELKLLRKHLKRKFLKKFVVSFSSFNQINFVSNSIFPFLKSLRFLKKNIKNQVEKMLINSIIKKLERFDHTAHETDKFNLRSSFLNKRDSF